MGKLGCLIVVLGLLAILALPVVLIVAAAFVYVWRAIYPYLVKLGRWAADLRNSIPWAIVMIVLIVFCFVAYKYVFSLFIVPGIIILLVFLFLLALAVVVWIVRIWRRLVPGVVRRFWALVHYVAVRFS